MPDGTEPIDVGPRVGEPFPDIALPDQTGQERHLHDLRSGRRMLVVFHRSAVW